MINPTQRPLPNSTLHSHVTNNPIPGGVRTHNPSKQTIADPRYSTHGHRDRPRNIVLNLILEELVPLFNSAAYETGHEVSACLQHRPEWHAHL